MQRGAGERRGQLPELGFGTMIVAGGAMKLLAELTEVCDRA
jgi:hypothetical protein